MCGDDGEWELSATNSAVADREGGSPRPSRPDGARLPYGKSRDANLNAIVVPKHVPAEERERIVQRRLNLAKQHRLLMLQYVTLQTSKVRRGVTITSQGVVTVL